MVRQTGRQLARVDSGTIRLAERTAISQRLGRLQLQLDELLEQHLPDAVAVEDIFSARNARSALALGQARGVALAAAGRRELPVFAYPPATVKRAVCGHGRADKTQVQRMVHVLLSLAERAGEDESDALAVAICHALCQRS